jgi:hypothetical protein
MAKTACPSSRQIPASKKVALPLNGWLHPRKAKRHGALAGTWEQSCSRTEYTSLVERKGNATILFVRSPSLKETFGSRSLPHPQTHSPPLLVRNLQIAPLQSWIYESLQHTAPPTNAHTHTLSLSLSLSLSHTHTHTHVQAAVPNVIEGGSSLRYLYNSKQMHAVCAFAYAHVCTYASSAPTLMRTQPSLTHSHARTQTNAHTHTHTHTRTHTLSLSISLYLSLSLSAHAYLSVCRSLSLLLALTLSHTVRLLHGASSRMRRSGSQGRALL